MIEIPRWTKEHKYLLKLLLIDSQLCNTLKLVFFVSFQKHLKAKTNILRYTKYIGEMKIPDNLLHKIKKQHPPFRLTHLYQYKIPANLTNIPINLDNFLIPV